MIMDVDRETLSRIKNPRLSAYASIYIDIYEDFMEQVKSTGIQIDPHDYRNEREERLGRLRSKGAVFRNDDKSIYVNWISPSCVACRKGIGSATFFISLKCHRSCFYCFNPNQEHYEYFTEHQRDLPRELEQIYQNGHDANHIALTGGEPLLHKDEAIAFFQTATERFPDAYTRLYTCGDHADQVVLQELQDAGLDEIRFSIRVHDLERGQRHTLDRIALATEYIPVVMVEMPVLPDTFEIMKEILQDLDRFGVAGINLLEFCYPFANTEIFNQKSFKIKERPFRILYNYWYAGGLPIARSELECLDLLEFAIDAGLQPGVHYCSLENKHTGQIFQQNVDQETPETSHFSEKDFFLKSAKVFGSDIPQAQKRLRRQGGNGYTINREHGFIEFHVSRIEDLKGLDIEVGISSSVMETREDGQYLRELKVDLTYPDVFDLETDV